MGLAYQIKREKKDKDFIEYGITLAKLKLQYVNQLCKVHVNLSQESQKTE